MVRTSTPSSSTASQFESRPVWQFHVASRMPEVLAEPAPTHQRGSECPCLAGMGGLVIRHPPCLVPCDFQPLRRPGGWFEPGSTSGQGPDMKAWERLPEHARDGLEVDEVDSLHLREPSGQLFERDHGAPHAPRRELLEGCSEVPRIMGGDDDFVDVAGPYPLVDVVEH